jgi:hypothetical protein
VRWIVILCKFAVNIKIKGPCLSKKEEHLCFTIETAMLSAEYTGNRGRQGETKSDSFN